MKGFSGRSVDVLMRSDGSFNNGSPEECLQHYFTKSKTKTAKLLSRKAVVGLYPESVFSKVLWNCSSNKANSADAKKRGGRLAPV